MKKKRKKGEGEEEKEGLTGRRERAGSYLKFAILGVTSYIFQKVNRDISTQLGLCNGKQTILKGPYKN